MRRSLLLLALMAAALGLTACGDDADTAAETVTKTVVSESSEDADTTEPSTPGNSGIVPPNKRAEVLCRGGQESGDQGCVIAGEKVTGDLDFVGYRVVKLIDVQISGDVVISGVKEAVITSSMFDGDLDIESTGGIVVKTSTVRGELELSGAQHATVVQNTVDGDLSCDVRRANGAGNQVRGTTTGACSRLRG